MTAYYKFQESVVWGAPYKKDPKGKIITIKAHSLEEALAKANRKYKNRMGRHWVPFQTTYISTKEN